MSDKSVNHHLTVNNEDFITNSVNRKTKITRKTRALSPLLRSPSPAVSLNESLLNITAASSTEDLRRPKSATSLYNLSRTNSSDSLRKHHKSIDNLCFARKKQHRRAHIHEEVYRPRSYTDPSNKEDKPTRPLTIPILRIPEDEISQEQNDDEEIHSSPSDTTNSSPIEKRKRRGSGAVLQSLLKQTIKVTTASMGFRAASMERLAPSSLRPLNEDDKHRFSRSTSSVSTLAQLPPDSLSPMAPLQTHTECQSVQCLNILDKDYQTSSSSSLATNNNNNNTTSSSPPQKHKRGVFQHQLSIPESLQSTSIGCATSSEYTSARSLKHSATSLTPLSTLNSSGSLRSISPSRRSASSNSSSTAKHEQQSTAAASAAAAAAAVSATLTTNTTSSSSNGSSSSSATTTNATTATTAGAATAAITTTPPEKEKKRKEISSSRVKKFHRHFAQVSKDEKLINYFSCALVSDILLQGHLYITDQHFAFYSNVFGYVTKVVIPTSSVTKISKEKTAKIIPNAVGVATADERHVFGSFISREAAFRLMCSVCPPLGVPEILPKDPASIEISEEYSIEDDSSCSISGNESPAQITELQNGVAGNDTITTTTNQTILRRSVGSSNLSIADMRHSDIPKTNAKITTNNNNTTASSMRSSAPAATAAHYTNGSGVSGGAGTNVNLLGLKTILQPALKTTTETGESGNKLTIISGCASSTTSATSTPTPSTSSSPTTVMTPGLLPNTNGGGSGGGGVTISKVKQRVMNIFTSVNKKLMLHLKFPTEIHVVYLGVMLTLLLALFSIFLLYRILDIEAKTNGYRSPVEFNWRSGNDDDIFSEALRFQKQLQLKSTEEAQNILKTNLEQIAKVRRSLETLSMLIHDRSSSFVSTHTDDSD